MTATDADLAAEVARLRQQLAAQQQRADHAEADRDTARRAGQEAQEQQTATSEIMRAISTSPTDPQQALHLVAESASRFAGVDNVYIWRLIEDKLHEVAKGGTALQSENLAGPVPTSRQGPMARAVAERRTIHLEDLTQHLDEFPETRTLVEHGRCTLLVVPLLHQGRAVGTLNSVRNEVRPFTPQQIALLESFADQAVIAIENARLYSDLNEALDQQTAMATVLSAVARAGSDPEPVLFDIAEQAARLLDGDSGGLVLFDGEVSFRGHIVQNRPINAADLPPDRDFTIVAPDRMRATRQTPRSELAKDRTHIGEMLLTRRPAQVWGTRAEVLVRYPDARIGEGWQELSRLAVPLLVAGDVIGYLNVARRVARPFTDQQIALLETFADQAVIAVENARLLNELQASNADLHESLERQTATAEVLRIIASTPTNAQPVFEAIVQSGARLTNADRCTIHLPRGEGLGPVA